MSDESKEASTEKRSHHKKMAVAGITVREQVVDVTCCFCQNKGKAIIEIDDAGLVVAVTIKS